MRSDRAAFAPYVLVALLPIAAGCTPFFTLDEYEGPARDGGGFCTPGAVFCDDFEHDDLTGPWTASAQNGGTLSILAGTPTGRALASNVFASPNVDQVFLSKETGVPAGSVVEMRFRARIATTPNFGWGVHAMQLRFVDGGNESVIIPYINGAGIGLPELVCKPSCKFDPSDPVPFTAGDWHDVAATVDFRSTPAKYHLDVDGRVLDRQSTFGAFPGLIRIYGGAASVDPDHDAVELDIDNVVVTTSN